MNRTHRVAALAVLGVAAALGGVAAARAAGGEGDGAPAARERRPGASRLERRIGRAWLRRTVDRREARLDGRREKRDAFVARVMAMPEDTAREARAAADRSRDLREEARTRAAAILAKAWRDAAGADAPARAAARASAREALRALRDEMAPRFAEVGRPVADAFAGERRAEIEKRLAEKGRVLDADRVATRIGRRLGGPLVRALLDERLRGAGR